MRKVCLIPLLILVHTACMNGKPSIVGQWSFTGVDPQYVKSYGISNQEITEMIQKGSMEFRKDGRFIARSGRDADSGIYTYIEKDKSLILAGAAEGSKTMKFTVDLQNDLLALSNEFGKMSLHRK